uniref:Uncharacterized protein n=1 Tax=Ciona savignyi TaxID=51511 RepID=H2Z0F8_CIOSA
MVAPVNSHTNVNLSALKPYGNGVSLPRITPATRASIRRHKRPTSPLEMPRIVELEVQGGLRRAKSTIVEKLMAQPQNHYDVAQSYTSQIHLRDFKGENSDHCLPPIAPDIKRPSSIPSPQRLKSRASTKQSSRSKATSKDRTLSPTKKNPQKPETSTESDTSVSPTSERSSSRHSAALPDIN